MAWQAWCALVGGGLVVAGAGLSALFLFRYVRFGESSVPWRGHALFPIAADGRKFRLGAVGAGALLAGLVLVVIPGVVRALT